MPELTLDGVTIAYDVFGSGDPVVLVCGCSQPALAWQLNLVPELTAAGYQVVTFDNRGGARRRPPRRPYSVAAMAADALGPHRPPGAGRRCRSPDTRWADG